MAPSTGAGRRKVHRVAAKHHRKGRGMQGGNFFDTMKNAVSWLGQHAVGPALSVVAPLLAKSALGLGRKGKRKGLRKRGRGPSTPSPACAGSGRRKAHPGRGGAVHRGRGTVILG